MRKYFKINEIIKKRINYTFYVMISRFTNIEFSFQMSEILPYLLNYVYLQICGALEKKIEVCQYYLMSINYDYAYKRRLNSIYNSEALFNFFKDVDEYFSIGFSRYNKGNWLVEFIYKHHLNQKYLHDIIINEIDERFCCNNHNSALFSYTLKQYNDFKKYWRNLNSCIDECKYYISNITTPALFLNELYKKIWAYRHTIAHNLNSLYYDAFDDSIYLNNYFFRIALLFSIDEVLIDIMENIITNDIDLC